jgi:hypothetical protein
MFSKFFLASLCVLTSLNSYAQLSGGFYGPEDCVKGEWQQREIVKSSEKINIHTYKSLCKSRPNGEIIESKSTCVGIGNKVPSFAECMTEKKGIKHTNSGNGEGMTPKFLDLSKQLAEQSKSDKAITLSGGFYNAEDCVQGEWQQMEVSGEKEKHLLHSFTSLCKSRPNGEVVVAHTECVGEGDKVPSLAECMKNSSSLVSKGSGNGDSLSQRYIEFSSEFHNQRRQIDVSPNLEDCSKHEDGRSISCSDGLYIKSNSVVESARVSGKDDSTKKKSKPKSKKNNKSNKQ